MIQFIICTFCAVATFLGVLLHNMEESSGI